MKDGASSPPSARRRSRLSRAGQIVMPAMFVFPSLMLFIYLIFETAKLSREKIRHQFAIDAAAFVEMTNYSDFLNRTAYVNGAFPMRIFYEGFNDTRLDCMGKGDCPGPTPIADLLWKDGAFPRSMMDKNPNSFAASDHQSWDIQYNNSARDMDADPPEVGKPAASTSGTQVTAVGGGGDNSAVTIISLDTAKQYNINWDDANQIYKLYVQIYQLLGSVESAQKSVLTRLAAGHNFLKKSYYLNTGGPEALTEAGNAVNKFHQSASSFNSTLHCVGYARFYANQIVNSWLQPYQIYGTEPPVQLPSTISDCSGLFQVTTVKDSVLTSMGWSKSGGSPSAGPSGYPGWEVETTWTAPNNYFNVNFNNKMESGMPKVHATVAVRGFGGAQPAIWPKPTPKFQVRLYP